MKLFLFLQDYQSS